MISQTTSSSIKLNKSRNTNTCYVFRRHNSVCKINKAILKTNAAVFFVTSTPLGPKKLKERQNQKH